MREDILSLGYACIVKRRKRTEINFKRLVRVAFLKSILFEIKGCSNFNQKLYVVLSDT